MSLTERFEEAVAKSKTLTTRPDNQTLLNIYALYKQGTQGDVRGDKPGFVDMVGRAKYEAWEGQQGKSQDEAMSEYIALIDRLADEAF
ncbi:MAG TPA: acyl-CoA-binding protein [Magnetospirillaceae bacterium]|nr:acyl-CoA-binding protein [Magnetospirillaceae bacterium]